MLRATLEDRAKVHREGPPSQACQECPTKVREGKRDTPWSPQHLPPASCATSEAYRVVVDHLLEAVRELRQARLQAKGRGQERRLGGSCRSPPRAPGAAPGGGHSGTASFTGNPGKGHPGLSPGPRWAAQRLMTGPKAERPRGQNTARSRGGAALPVSFLVRGRRRRKALGMGLLGGVADARGQLKRPPQAADGSATVASPTAPPIPWSRGRGGKRCAEPACWGAAGSEAGPAGGLGLAAGLHQHRPTLTSSRES